MRFCDLDGNQFELKINNRVLHKKRNNQSGLHKEAKKILKELFPLMGVYDECSIQINKNKSLYIDLFIPEANLAVEVNGKQHYTFTRLFHKSKLDLFRAIANDNLKKEWCDINNIQLIVLRYDEIANWKEMIEWALKKT